MNILAPKPIEKNDEDWKNVEPYLSTLEGVLKVNNAKNIAVSGAYGSGKSSILLTFQQYYHKEYNFLGLIDAVRT